MTIDKWGQVIIDFRSGTPTLYFTDWMFSGEPDGVDHATDMLHQTALRILKREEGQSVVLREATGQMPNG